jgi:hypothetical protein
MLEFFFYIVGNNADNAYLLQKQLTSTSLVQFKFALASAKQLVTVKKGKKSMSQPSFFTKKKKKKKKGSPQVETPLKLGNCAELVGLAELVEMVVPVVALAFADDVLLPLPPLVAADDVRPVNVDVEDVASCDDHTIDAKSWRTKNKGRRR